MQLTELKMENVQLKDLKKGNRESKLEKKLEIRKFKNSKKIRRERKLQIRKNKNKKEILKSVTKEEKRLTVIDLANIPRVFEEMLLSGLTLGQEQVRGAEGVLALSVTPFQCSFSFSVVFSSCSFLQLFWEVICLFVHSFFFCSCTYLLVYLFVYSFVYFVLFS